MSAVLISLVLGVHAPEPTPAPAPSEEPAASEEPAPSEEPAEPSPPPPTLDGPPPETTPPPEPVAEPASPELGEATIGPEPSEDDEDAEDADELVRDTTNLPLGATAARRSATRRNNDVLVRPFRQPVYTIAAAARFGTLLTGGADVIQPFGYGFAAQLRIHFAPIFKSRFGVEIHAGHTRFGERKDYETVEGSPPIKRWNLLTDTDFSAGPSLQLPLGPLYLQVGGSAGVALSTLLRPRSSDSTDDETVTSTNFMLRGGLSVGVPILNRHGLTVGAGVHHIFSRREVLVDLDDPDGLTTRPFATWLEVLLGYQIWF